MLIPVFSAAGKARGTAVISARAAPFEFLAMDKGDHSVNVDTASRSATAAQGVHAARRRKVVKAHHRLDAAFAAGLQDVAIMLQCRQREHAIDGHDARPFYREAKGIQAKSGQQGNVLLVEAVMIHC